MNKLTQRAIERIEAKKNTEAKLNVLIAAVAGVALGILCAMFV